MNEVRATSILDRFDINFFQAKSSQHERWQKTSQQMRFFQELFPREACVGKCIKCSRTFCNTLWKTFWLSPFLLMYWSCNPYFYLRNADFLMSTLLFLELWQFLFIKDLTWNLEFLNSFRKFSRKICARVPAISEFASWNVEFNKIQFHHRCMSGSFFR